VNRTRGGPGRVGSVFFALGCLTVLGTAFAAGMSAGRSWPSFMTWIGPRPVAVRAEVPRRAGEARPPTPALTFYDELAAPLGPTGAATPAMKTTGSVPPPAGARAVEAAAPDRRPVTAAPSDRMPTRFTVQVGAFKARGPADALRARLVASGDEAYVVEGEPPGARYRVRVGAFATRDEARQAARRLALERQVATYVTPR
jgi:cell division protein FtsN